MASIGKFILALLFVSFHVWSASPYKLKSFSEIPVCDNTYIELSHLPPVRDQGTLGMCYAHSSVLLLDYLRCGKSLDPDNCYKERGSVLHAASFDIRSGIHISGTPTMLLSLFREKRQLATESCADYEAWKNLEKDYRSEIKGLKLGKENQYKADFFYLISQMNKTATDEERLCWAQDIVSAGVHQDLENILAILKNSKASYASDLRYKILVPSQCSKNMITYPEYKLTVYPPLMEKKTEKGIKDFVFRTLSAGAPLEARLCVTRKKDKCLLGHSLAITGQRYICSKSSCRQEFRVQNSFGQGWQKKNNDGWIDADKFIEHMEGPGLGLMAILPKDMALDTSLENPEYSENPVNKKVMGRLKGKDGCSRP